MVYARRRRRSSMYAVPRTRSGFYYPRPNYWLGGASRDRAMSVDSGFSSPRLIGHVRPRVVTPWSSTAPDGLRRRYYSSPPPYMVPLPSSGRRF